MMRVAIWHDLPSGGALRALVGQIRELLKLEHDVAVWTPNSLGVDFSAEWWPSDIVQHHLPFRGEYRATYLDQRFDAPFDLYEWRRKVLDDHAREVVPEIARWQPDVLLVHPCWWFFASPLAKYWDGPSVLYLQEPNRWLYEAAPDNVWAAGATAPRRTLRSLVGHAIREYRQVTFKRRCVRNEIDWVRAFDRVLVNSLYSRESVLRAYGVDAVFCPLGVDHGAFASLPPTPKRRVVVSLGELGPHKDPRLAIEAVSRIPASRRPPLRWFGNRANEGFLGSLQRDAERLGVDFTFRCAIPDDELAQELASAACFIFCARLEPLGLSPLEANLAGTAVVAVGEGGVRETILDGVNGSVVYNRDPDELARAMEHYLDDLEFAATAGARARMHVQRCHRWEHAGRILERELLRALPTKASAGSAASAFGARPSRVESLREAVQRSSEAMASRAITPALSQE